MAFNLDDYQSGQSLSAEHLQQGVRAVRGVQRGVFPPAADDRINQLCLVKIEFPAAGGGVYTGRIFFPSETAIDPAVTATEAVIGTVFIEDVVIINPRELGKNTHDITSAPAGNGI